jgi:hypothetical protein
MKSLVPTILFLANIIPLVFGAPPPCKGGPLQITSLTWFNSSTNLNCPLSPDPKGLCLTGRPTKPPGYGPPDYVSFNVKNVATGRSSKCKYQNPGSVPAKGEPGRAGLTKCSTGDQSFTFDFVAGPSNGKGGSVTGRLSVTDRLSRCRSVLVIGDVRPFHVPRADIPFSVVKVVGVLL